MIRRRPSLKRDARGATIVEFAMVAPVLVVLLLGSIDLGYKVYAASILQGAMHEAARMATVGGVTTAQIETRVRDRLRAFARNANPTTLTKSYSDFTGVRRPETITSDTAPIGVYNAGDCYEDANNNGSYDLDRGRSGTGGADDVVYFEATLTYTRLVPLGTLLGWSNTETISANTMLRNQPYAARTTGAPIRC